MNLFTRANLCNRSWILSISILIISCYADPEVNQIPGPYVEFGANPQYRLPERDLLFIDLFALPGGKQIWRYSELDDAFYGVHVIDAEGDAGFVIPVEGQSGKYIYGYGLTAKYIEWDGFAEEVELAGDVFDVDDYETTDLNNGKISPNGQLYTATKREAICEQSAAPNGSLYIYTPGQGLAKEISDRFYAPNGMVWKEEEESFFFVDSCLKTIFKYHYDPVTGATSDEEEVINFFDVNSSYYPHGMDMDTEGNLWMAAYKSGTVYKIDSDTGEILDTVVIEDTIDVLDVAFGGPDCQTLYVTSGRREIDENPVQIGSGQLYVVTGHGATGYLCTLREFNE